MARGSWLRVTVWLGVTALAVHHLRYLLAFGERSGEELAEQGHAYLLVVAPLAAAAFAGVLAHVLIRALAGPADRSQAAGCGLCASTVACAVAILAIYVGQEAIEGILAPGHAGGFAGIFEERGWLAIPLAAIAAPPVALAMRAGEGSLAARIPLAPPPGRRVDDRGPAPRAAFSRRLAPLAARLAGRAPPLPA